MFPPHELSSPWLVSVRIACVFLMSSLPWIWHYKYTAASNFSQLPTNSDFLPATQRDALIPSFFGYLVSQICMIDFSSLLTFELFDLPSDLLSYWLSDRFWFNFFRMLLCLFYIIPLLFMPISCNDDWFVKLKYDEVYVTIFIFTNKDAYNNNNITTVM